MSFAQTQSADKDKDNLKSMPRILGLVIQDGVKVDYGLTLLKGIGWSLSKKVLNLAGIDKSKRVKDLTEEDIKKITSLIEKTYKVEGDLREEVAENIKRLKEISSYRGTRHAHGLPVYGQRTKSNARTKRGKRKTVGALKKEDQMKVDASAKSTVASK
jgi:small subunit ribosomal protein S13